MMVMCWLGEAKDDSHLAFRIMKAWGNVLIANGLADHNQVIDERYGEKVLNAVEEMSDPFNLRAWKAVMKCLNRPWWSRVWMVQEFILGKNAMLQCGQNRMSWRQLSAAAAISTPEVHDRIGPQEQFNVKAATMYVQRSLYHASPREDFLLRDALIVALNDNSRRSSTDPRDKVYGVLGLMSASGQSLMQVDYSLSIEEICIIVARQSMLVSPHTEKDPILDLLREAGTSNRAPALLGKIPTWVPDWQKHVGGGKITNSLPSSKYCATKGSHSDPRFSKDGLTLHVWGAVLDRVSSKFDVFHPPGQEIRPWVQDEIWKIAGLLGGGEQYPTGITRLEALFRTTTCDIDTFLQRWNDNLTTVHAYLATFCVELAEARLKGRGKTGRPSSIQEAVRSEKDMPADTGFGSIFSATSIGLPRFPDDYDFDQGWEMSSRLHTMRGGDPYTQKRCYFSTEKSYLGLGPIGTREGDLICVLFGSNVPHVLRENNGEYILIGEAYIHGFMDGEAMEQLEAGVLVPREFAIK